ncbi:MAG: hypothetical protein D6718_02000 [Acidobacteria bacterium]|nr:MAG: hypothetical protein D6718_02000 [Acidobacteriota bacterium]
MTGGRRGPWRALLGVAAIVAGGSPALGGWEEVPIDVPLPPVLETEAGERVLVARFNGPGHPTIDVGLEVARWVKRRLARRTSLDVLDVPPPPIPEQRPEQLAANDLFWKRLGGDFSADLIVAGVARYEVEDRSGFVNEDVTSPLTGQTVRRTRYREMTGYRLRLDIFFFKGDNGALLHHDVWQEEAVLGEEDIPEDLDALFRLLDAMGDDLDGVFLPGRVQEPRYIWVE